ncbi:MAG: hypothetical protein LPJ87_03780 [Zoogloeaceae bacterium]|nr:hypothetical protein [Zoogloeaceae bacterium]
MAIRRSPKVGKYFLLSVRDELLALLMFCRYQWYVVIGVLGVVLLAIWFISPFPPSKLRIAAGQENSTLEFIARQYGDYLAGHGVTVEYLTTRGAADNLRSLREGLADVAFSQGGLPIARDEGILSLGSVGYQPLWFFYRGEVFEGDDFVEFLAGKRISIGLPGSGTRPVADALMEALPDMARGRIGVFEMPAAESALKLLRGEIDGMFLLAGMESGNAQALLTQADVHILSYPVADALTKYIGYMEVITLPKGSLELSPPRPAQDVHMVATTTTVLAKEDLHPALQYLFMRATTELSFNERAVFERVGGFPAFTEHNVPRSEVAERYLQNGPPLLESYAPYWVASFFDRAWFAILAVIAVAYPLLRMLPGYRKTAFDIGASYKYAEIFKLAAAVEHSASADELPGHRSEYERLEHEIREMWIPKGCQQAFYFLLGALEIVEEKLVLAEQRLGGASTKAAAATRKTVSM